MNSTEHIKSTAKANNCEVKSTWFGFYKIWKASNQIFDSVGLSLPSYSYDSQAYFSNSMFCSIPYKCDYNKIENSVTKRGLSSNASQYFCSMAHASWYFRGTCCAGKIEQVLLVPPINDSVKVFDCTKPY